MTLKTPFPLVSLPLPVQTLAHFHLQEHGRLQKSGQAKWKREFSWTVPPAADTRLTTNAASPHIGLGLLVFGLHALVVWLLLHPIELPPPPPEPVPLVVSLIQPASKLAKQPDVLPLLQKPVTKPKQITPKTTPVLPQPTPRPQPVVERVVESATNTPKSEATVADTAPASEAPQAAAPSVVTSVASAAPKLDSEEKEEPPKFGVAYLNNPSPEYPRLAKRAGEQGKVVMKVLVTAEGLPASVEVNKSSGFERLDAAAVSAVKQWRFEPARKGGKAVSAYVLVPLSFSLNERG